MATFYLDPESGNDALDGLTFANRWKTVNQGATFARTNPGDTIRIIASRDPYLIGTATWTPITGFFYNATTNADRITFTTPAPFKLVEDCVSGWTAATNITVAFTTTSRKSGTACLSITPLTAFVTGKMCHKTFAAPLDLSEFSGLSFWNFGGSSAIVAGRLEVRLCSDTLGEDVVHTIPIGVNEASAWTVMEWQNGAPLDSNINSMSVWATVDPGTVLIRFDNFVAVRDPSAADYVSHQCAFGKHTTGEPEWYSILSFTDTGIMFGGGRTAVLGTGRQAAQYEGVGETVTTYALAPLNLVNNESALSSTNRATREAGSFGAPITYSGGWNRTDMSTQTGYTYFSGRHYYGYALENSYSFVNFERIGGMYFTAALIGGTTGNFTGGSLDLGHVIGCLRGPVALSSFTFGRFHIKTLGISGADMDSVSLSTAGTTVIYRLQIVMECDYIIGTTSNGSDGIALYVQPGCDYYINRIRGNRTANLVYTLATLAPSRVFNANMFKNAVVNTNPTVTVSTAATLELHNCTVYPEVYGRLTQDTVGRMILNRRAGDPNDYRVLRHHYNVLSDTTIRHTDSGLAWRIDVLFAPSLTVTEGPIASSPATLTLLQVALQAGVPVTIKCWVRRNTNMEAGIQAKMSDFSPISAFPIRALATGAVNTWEEVTLTFTPEKSAVVEIEGIAWGAVASAWFDDVSVS
jgi:hypothetical protein